MPSKSPAQARLMRAAAHTPGGFGGVPQKVGREFTAADKAKSRKSLDGARDVDVRRGYRKAGSAK